MQPSAGLARGDGGYGGSLGFGRRGNRREFSRLEAEGLGQLYIELVRCMARAAGETQALLEGPQTLGNLDEVHRSS